MWNGLTYAMLEWVKDASWSKVLRLPDYGVNKILQVSKDGPIVNLKFHRDVQSNSEELELLKLNHGAFKTGVESTD